METRKQAFDKRMQSVAEMFAITTASDQYLENIACACRGIAKTVLMGVKSDFGTPLMEEVVNLAKQSDDFISNCAIYLKHAVAHGEDVGLTTDYLRAHKLIPEPILKLVDALVRKKGMSQVEHCRQLTADHRAVVAMMQELVARADITKYNKPTKEHHVRCCALLDRAASLKNYRTVDSDFEYGAENTIIDYLCDLRDIVNISLSENMGSDTQRMYWINYPGSQRAIGHVSAAIDSPGVLKIFLNLTLSDLLIPSVIIENIVNFGGDNTELVTIFDIFDNDFAPETV